MLSGLTHATGTSASGSAPRTVQTPRLANVQLSVDTHTSAQVTSGVTSPSTGALASPSFALHHVVQARSGYSPRHAPAMPITLATAASEPLKLHSVTVGARSTAAESTAVTVAAHSSSGRRAGAASSRDYRLSSSLQYQA